MQHDNGVYFLSFLLFGGAIWTGWLFWAAISPHASSGQRNFAEWMLSTSWVCMLILTAVRGTDAHFDAKKQKAEEAKDADA